MSALALPVARPIPQAVTALPIRHQPAGPTLVQLALSPRWPLAYSHPSTPHLLVTPTVCRRDDTWQSGFHVDDLRGLLPHRTTQMAPLGYDDLRDAAVAAHALAEEWAWSPVVSTAVRQVA